MNMENKDLEKAVYKWFNIKYEYYYKLKHDDSVYLYYEGMEYADIRIDRKYKYIYFKFNFWEEFSDIFPIKYNDFKQVLSIWVRDTFNLKGFVPYASVLKEDEMLIIPK